MLAGFYFCFTWLFAYPALLRFPDREIPDFYPIFIMLHTWDGLRLVVFVRISKQLVGSRLDPEKNLTHLKS